MFFTRFKGIKITLFGLFGFFFSYTIAATAPDTQRLACIFYDKSHPTLGMSAFHPGLPSVWAKGQENENIYVNGEMRDGFFIARNFKGKVRGLMGSHVIAHYENSYGLALAFCRKGLEIAFPDSYQSKEIMNVVVKSSFLSFRYTPAVFKHHHSKFITQFDKLVIFGDSLSDQGNLKHWLRVFPRTPYFAGRFSNERIWVDYLQNMTGLSVQNWAVGGSVTGRFLDPEFNNQSLRARFKTRARNLASGSVKTEIQRYKNKSLSGERVSDPDSTLFALWIGGNDYLSTVDKDEDADIFLDYPNDLRIGSKAMVNRVTDNVIKNLERLYSLGARNFLVGNMPDLGKIPRLLGNTSYHKKVYESPKEKLMSLSQKMTEVTMSHNSSMKTKVAEFEASHPGSILVLIDAFSGLNFASDSISLEDGTTQFDYGFSKTFKEKITLQNHSLFINKACMPGRGVRALRAAVCFDPNRALFFDEVHPTTFGHCLIAAFFHQAAAQKSFLKPSSLADYVSTCRASTKA